MPPDQAILPGDVDHDCGHGHGDHVLKIIAVFSWGRLQLMYTISLLYCLENIQLLWTYNIE